MSFAIKPSCFFAVCFLAYLRSFCQDPTVHTPPAYPQGIPVNYVRTWSAVKPTTNAGDLTLASSLWEARVTTQYLDGLGRPLQTVEKQGSFPTGGSAVDRVSASIYDELGREVRKYLPFAASGLDGNASINDGLLKANPFQQQQYFYSDAYSNGSAQSPIKGQGETYYYGKTEFEASPLNRVDRTYAPGDSWVNSGKGVKTNHWINTATDAVRIWYVTDVDYPDAFGYYTSPAAYPAGELYKTVTEDEHGKQVIEFKDKEGRVVLKKVQLTALPDNGTGTGYNGWLCTYYIYDDLGQLRCVIQPKGVEMAEQRNWNLGYQSIGLLPEFCFRYAYDHRGRMTTKKVPGTAAAYFIYDARDRLVMTQHATLARMGQWLVTRYDELNRVIETGLWSNEGEFSDHFDAAANSTNYPNPATDYEVLTQTHYDDYVGIPARLSSSLLNAYGSSLDAPAADYPEPLTPAASVNGLVAWTRTKVLGENKYLSSCNIYDEKGRVIQVQSLNYTGGLDVVTNQYAFAGQILRSHTHHTKGGTVPQTYEIATRYAYDELKRLVMTEENVNSIGWKVVSQTEYDALGQLRTKKVGQDPKVPGQPLETTIYDYNIRGWLLGANKDYLSGTGPNRYFGFELGYDKDGTALNASRQYNGNIGHQAWRSAGDGERRKYDYGYDAANRLLSADFNQYSGGGFDKSAGLDFSVSNLGYDANGNILSMRQRGWKPLGSGSALIDDLLYTYDKQGASNRLQNVIDLVNDPYTTLGDFRASRVYTDQVGTKDPARANDYRDYTYDGSGNLLKDLNKDIRWGSGGGIEYNHLNLPRLIRVAGPEQTDKGIILYTYDAAGNKLRKLVQEQGKPDKTSLYLFGTYQDNALQFLPMEEGRIRPTSNPNQPFAFDYMLKDHLGNVRALLTDEEKQDPYPAATMEPSAIDNEALVYENVSTTQHAQPAWFSDPLYPNSATVARVKNTGSTKKTGPGILLKVMAGDSYNVRVASGWNDGSTPNNRPLEVFTELLGVLSSSVSIMSGGKVTQVQLQAPGSGFATQLSSFLSAQTNSGSAPKAYLNWVLLDERFELAKDAYGNSFGTGFSGFEQVGASGATTIHNKVGLEVAKSGYLYIYTSNEATNVDVFFDNLQITHIHGPLLEETHYYPFGLAMSGISSKAAGGVENKKKYNGIEFDNDFEINTYEAQFRNLDPQIGRWWQTDPVTDGYEHLSPYASMYDDPMKISDPLGNEGEDCCFWETVKALVNTSVELYPKLLAGGARQTMIMVGGTMNGAMNRMSLGIWPTDPMQTFTGYNGMTTDEQNLYNGAAATGQAVGLPLPGDAPVVSGGQGGGMLQLSSATIAHQEFKLTTSANSVNLSLSKALSPIVNATGSRVKNKLQPDQSADGSHSTFKRDQNGDVYKYQEWHPNTNPRDPKKFVPGKRFDGGQPNGTPGKPHNNIPTPHVNDNSIPGGARKPNPNELPNNKRF